MSGCLQRPQEDKILKPEITASFYLESAERLEEILKESDKNEDYQRLQLRYYEQLDWPRRASNSIKRARNSLKLDLLLARMYCDFYFKHQMYFELLEVYKELETQYVLPAWMINYGVMANNQLGKTDEALSNLRSYFSQSRPMNDHVWGGIEYLNAGDSLLSLYHLLQAIDLEKGKAYLMAFVPLAQKNGMNELAIGALEEYVAHGPEDVEMKIYLSELLYTQGKSTLAKKQMWEVANEKVLVTLSDWYVQEYKWDSAHICLDSVLVMDSENKGILMKKGNIDQRRGWFQRALVYYDQVLVLDSTFVEASNQRALVERKIAYLRRIQEVEQEIPTLNLNRRKRIE